MASKHWAALLIFGAGVLGTPALAEGLFAAITFSPSTGQAGTAWNYETGALAETEAFLRCGNQDCYTAVIFQQCAALAVGDGNGMGFASDQSEAKAQDTALANCNGYTANCEVVASQCNDGF